MFRSTLAAALFAVFAFAATSAAEVSAHSCLNKDAQRTAIAEHRAIPLAEAMKTVRPRHKGELVRARLCQGQDGGLVYVLTLLARNGKVTRATVDANSGNLISGR